MLAVPLVPAMIHGGVLHRQRVAGERHHAAASLMCSSLRTRSSGLRSFYHRHSRVGCKIARDGSRAVPPLSANLRDFPESYAPVALR